MPSHNNDLKVAAIKKFGVAGMRWGSQVLQSKVRHDHALRTNRLAHQAGLDAAVTSTIADAMEEEVRGSRRRTKTEKDQHVLALKAVHSRMFRAGVDAKLLLELIQSNSMTGPQRANLVQSAKGAVALHSWTKRATGSQILSHAEFLRGLSRRLAATARKYDSEIEDSPQYFVEGSPTLKPVSEMSDRELIHHFK